MEEQVLTLTCNLGGSYGLTQGKTYKGKVNQINVQDGVAFIWLDNDNKRNVNVKLSRFSIN